MSAGWRLTIAMEHVAHRVFKFILAIRVICSLFCALDLTLASRLQRSTTEESGFNKQGGPHAESSARSCAVLKKPHFRRG